MAARRRKRFVVGYVDSTGQRKTIDVVAYDKISAKDTAIRHGYDAVSVRPYVKGERVEVPADGGWKLNTKAFYEACAELGLEWRVAIKQTGQKGNRMGCHIAKALGDGTPYHHITVKSYLTADDAGRTLWHELRHAAQSEKLAAETGTLPGTNEFRREHRRVYRNGVSYLAKRWEVEARATEPNNDRLPLARSSR